MIKLREIPLGPKLTALLLLTGLIPLLAYWWQETLQVDQVLTSQATARLETARHNGIEAIKRYFAERRTDMDNLVHFTTEIHQNSLTTLTSLRDLNKERLETYFASHLQGVTSLATNPDFIKRMAAIDWIFRQAGRKTDNKHWRETVESFSPWLTNHDGQEALYFISAAGDVVYTATSQSELGQNINQKPLKDTSLARLFHQAMESPTIQDFHLYPPANNLLSAFIGAPVKKDGTPLGVVVMRLAQQKVSKLLNSTLDPTSSMTLHVAAADGLRSDALQAKIQSSALQLALTGKTGSGSQVGQSGQPVLAAWTPINFHGLRWAIVAEQEIVKSLLPQPQETKNWLQKFSDSAGYYDLFLIHPDGTVLYTTARQADFATNLLTGKYAETNLGQLVRKVLRSKQFSMSDLLPYPPSDNQPAFFMAKPVMDKEKIVLIMALQLPPDALSNLIHQISSAQSDIQTFLVGPDQKLRADALTDPKNPATTTGFIGGTIADLVAPLSLQFALAGQTGTQTTKRANDKSVLSSFAPVLQDDLNWALIMEMEQKLIQAAATPSWLVWAVILGVMFLVMLGARFIRYHLVYPLEDLGFTLNRLASGRFDPIVQTNRKDEVGILTRSINTVAQEISQAGHRIHDAAESLPTRMKRLAAMAIAITRNSPVLFDAITEAKAGIETTMRIFTEESTRLVEEHNSLITELATSTKITEKLSNLTKQTVAEGKQAITGILTALNQINTKIQVLQQATQEINQAIQKTTEETNRLQTLGKHGKQGKEFHTLSGSILYLTTELQTELTDLEQLLTDRIRQTSGMRANLDKLLSSIPTQVRHPPKTMALVQQHTLDTPLIALEKLDTLLKNHFSATKEIITATKALFDLTTNELHQATSFFPKHDSPQPILPEND